MRFITKVLLCVYRRFSKIRSHIEMTLFYFLDFTSLKKHYHAILQWMPDNYQQTANMFINHISDDQICMILNSSNCITANKIILDCLIERMSCREELLDLCDQLDAITTSHQLMVVISELRSGGCNFVELLKYISYECYKILAHVPVGAFLVYVVVFITSFIVTSVPGTIVPLLRLLNVLCTRLQ